MGRIADRFRGFLRKAGDKLFHKECAEPVEGHEDEKPATMLDDALSALSVISGKHDSAEETFGKISAQIEGISSSADVMPFAINRNEQRNISMILLSGSAAAMVFTAIGLPYISLIAAMAAAIAAFSFLMFNLLDSPCLAAIATMAKEMNDKKWFWFAIFFQNVFAYIVCLCFYQIGSFVTGGAFGIGTVVGFVVLIAMLFLLFRPDPYKDQKVYSKRSVQA